LERRGLKDPNRTARNGGIRGKRFTVTARMNYLPRYEDILGKRQGGEKGPPRLYKKKKFIRETDIEEWVAAVEGWHPCGLWMSRLERV